MRHAAVPLPALYLHKSPQPMTGHSGNWLPHSQWPVVYPACAHARTSPWQERATSDTSRGQIPKSKHSAKHCHAPHPLAEACKHNPANQSTQPPHPHGRWHWPWGGPWVDARCLLTATRPPCRRQSPHHSTHAPPGQVAEGRWDDSTHACHQPGDRHPGLSLARMQLELTAACQGPKKQRRYSAVLGFEEGPGSWSRPE